MDAGLFSPDGDLVLVQMSLAIAGPFQGNLRTFSIIKLEPWRIFYEFKALYHRLGVKSFAFREPRSTHLAYFIETGFEVVDLVTENIVHMLTLAEAQTLRGRVVWSATCLICALVDKMTIWNNNDLSAIQQVILAPEAHIESLATTTLGDYAFTWMSGRERSLFAWKIPCEKEPICVMAMNQALCALEFVPGPTPEQGLLVCEQSVFSIGNLNVKIALLPDLPLFHSRDFRLHYTGQFACFNQDTVVVGQTALDMPPSKLPAKSGGFQLCSKDIIFEFKEDVKIGSRVLASFVSARTGAKLGDVEYQRTAPGAVLLSPDASKLCIGLEVVETAVSAQGVWSLKKPQKLRHQGLEASLGPVKLAWSQDSATLFAQRDAVGGFFRVGGVPSEPRILSEEGGGGVNCDAPEIRAMSPMGLDSLLVICSDVKAWVVSFRTGLVVAPQLDGTPPLFSSPCQTLVGLGSKRVRGALVLYELKSDGTIELAGREGNGATHERWDAFFECVFFLRSKLGGTTALERILGFAGVSRTPFSLLVRKTTSGARMLQGPKGSIGIVLDRHHLNHGVMGLSEDECCWTPEGNVLVHLKRAEASGNLPCLWEFAV